MSPDAEKKFQSHIANYLQKQHGYTVLDQDNEITDQNYYLAEAHLMAFIRASQPETLKQLEDEYSFDAPMEIIRALKKKLEKEPLWVIFRKGLTVKGYEFKIYYPKPRSSDSVAHKGYSENRITFKTELVIDEDKRPDIVLFLNGLPIIVIELKHEASGQNVHNAVSQFTLRNQADHIFQLPFLYIASDTSDVKVATNPSHEDNFRWHNTGLKNEPQTKGEYPVEHLYSEMLALDSILEAISFYLVYVPKQEAEDNKPERAAYSIFPRYHQSRMVGRVANDALEHFTNTRNLGKKYLINHSAGSGKTLSISWLADRLHSLFKPGTNKKAVNMIFILTDRKSLDKNIRDELTNFSHLIDVIKFAKKSRDLACFIKDREKIIVTTQQKFAHILEKIEKDQKLKSLRVAFLIDEAHRSQDNKMGTAIRTPFRVKSSEIPDTEGLEEDKADPLDEIAQILRANDQNQLFVAFTATPSNSSVQLFGEAFDTYSEAEAIAEDCIVDVAANVISYKTLYHLSSPIVPKKDEKLYPAGIITKALKNVAFQDEGLIQYKAEVMLRIFDEQIEPLINGCSKAMIVTSSRMAGLSYFNIIKEKLREKHASDPERFNYKVLYAFSDFIHPDTNKEIRESKVNNLSTGELIEDRFEGDDYRLMVVASKFQTGFDQPLLAGMFLDKPVYDRNAVQTISRLNRCHNDKKQGVVVVDFTNNTDAIFKAFNKYRKGTPYETSEPNNEQCVDLHKEITGKGIFSDVDALEFLTLLQGDGVDATLQAKVGDWRKQFNDKLTESDERKAFVYLLSKFVKSYNFLACFFEYSKEISQFADFADFIGSQLIKEGTVSDLMKHIRKVELSKAAVKFQGVKGIKPQTIKTRTGGKGGGQPPKKVSIGDMIEKLKEQFNISDGEALVIKEVCKEKVADPIIVRNIQNHRDDMSYLMDHYKPQVRVSIEGSYENRGLYERLIDPKYTDAGSIFDTMASTVIQSGIELRA
jgi:type I restriction enzyme, R subunit